MDADCRGAADEEAEFDVPVDPALSLEPLVLAGVEDAGLPLDDVPLVDPVVDPDELPLAVDPDEPLDDVLFVDPDELLGGDENKLMLPIDKDILNSAFRSK